MCERRQGEKKAETFSHGNFVSIWEEQLIVAGSNIMSDPDYNVQPARHAPRPFLFTADL